MNRLFEEAARRGLPTVSQEALRLCLSRALDRLRQDCLAGTPRELDEAFWQEITDALHVVPAISLQEVRNGTGVVLHTNLGRAPWAPEAVAAAAQAAQATPVEMDLQTGKRGRRGAGGEDALTALTGAEAAFMVNNNASAVLLALFALARGQKVIVARGELVEIGGSYRMPEVVKAAGATMLEVGTTNRVHLHDYEEALADPDVACVFKAHTSNFRVEGFTGEPSVEELAALCKKHAVPFVYDIGSGILCGAELPGLAKESTVRSAVEGGCDLVTFSGDKLLGGPQAGLIVGARPLVEKLRRCMLARCLRLDKTLLAALEATLALHALGEEEARCRVPSLRRLGLTVDDLTAIAKEAGEFLLHVDSDFELETVSCASKVGSGASPTEEIPSLGLKIIKKGTSAEGLVALLRQGTPPIFARVQDGAALVDLRTW